MASRTRRALTGVLSAALVAVAAGPAGAQAPAPGTARATLDLGSLTLGGGDALELGGLEASATTEGERLGLVTVDLAGEQTLAARSGEPPVADASVTLAGGGTVGATALEAVDEGGEVRATVASLDADLTGGPLDLQASATAIEARVSADVAGAQQGARVTALSVTLDDLLGEEVVDGLSLDVLVDLGAQLRGDLDAEVTATLDDLLALRTALASGTGVDAAVAALAGVDLAAFRTALAEQLGATELLGIDDLEVAVTAEATAAGSTAGATCTVGSLRVLGAAVEGSLDCAGVAEALEGLEVGLSALVEGLPATGPVSVTVTGGQVTATAENARDGADLVADARVEGPQVTVAPFTLDAALSGDSLEDLLALLPVTAEVQDLLDRLGGVPEGSATAEVAGLDLRTVSISAGTSFLAGPDAPGGPGDPGVPPEGPGNPEECRTAPPAGEDPCVTRDAGEDRIDTAVHVSAAAFPDGAGVALLARSDVYADALAGSPLAGAGGGPILLTRPDGVDAGVRTELERLEVTRVVLLGGEVALDASVEAELRAMGLEVDRIGGANRFATAALIAAELGTTHPVAFLVEGLDEDPARGWPDAVSTAPYAAATGRPVLLATTTDLPVETRDALDRHGVTETIVVGGPVSVGAEVVAAVEAEGHGPRRLAGDDRFATSVAVAAEAETAGVLSAEGVYLATGEDWPDALVVGPAAAASGDLLFLVDGDDLAASPATRAALEARAAEIRTVRIVGGEATVSAAVEAQLRAALGGS